MRQRINDPLGVRKKKREKEEKEKREAKKRRYINIKKADSFQNFLLKDYLQHIKTINNSFNIICFYLWLIK